MGTHPSVQNLVANRLHMSRRTLQRTHATMMTTVVQSVRQIGAMVTMRHTGSLATSVGLENAMQNRLLDIGSLAGRYQMSRISLWITATLSWRRGDESWRTA